MAEIEVNVLTERIAQLICAKPIDAADALRLWTRYLSDDERQGWREEARPIAEALRLEFLVSSRTQGKESDAPA